MDDQNKKERQTIDFHQIKGPHFETRKVDGAIGSAGPTGISLSFYVERVAIPQTVTHEINDDGSLGKSIRATGKQGVIREIQTSITMELQLAKNVIEQLRDLVEKLENKESE